MFEIGKLAQITSEINRINLHVLGVSESKWTWSGKIRTTTGETVIYSRRDNNLHHGVAIILKKGVERRLLDWKPINNRLMSERLKIRYINITWIQCYAPTNDSSDVDKDDLYCQLQTETEKPHSTISLSSWGISMPKLEKTPPAMKELWESTSWGQ
jgi:hypothetical protein